LDMRLAFFRCWVGCLFVGFLLGGWDWMTEAKHLGISDDLITGFRA
jgi:hypothetical protein